MLLFYNYMTCRKMKSQEGTTLYRDAVLTAFTVRQDQKNWFFRTLINKLIQAKVKYPLSRFKFFLPLNRYLKAVLLAKAASLPWNLSRWSSSGEHNYFFLKWTKTFAVFCKHTKVPLNKFMQRLQCSKIAWIQNLDPKISIVNY